MRVRHEPADKGEAGGGPGGDGLLSALDERMRRIAEEVCRAMSDGDVGAVRVKTAARRLDMSEFRVLQLIREGKLKIVRPTPNTIRIPLTEIRRFQEGQQ